MKRMLAAILIFLLFLPCHAEEGLILPGEATPLCRELARALTAIGLWDEPSESRLTPDLLSSLNTFRRAQSLPECSYCDPASLRRLGIPCEDSETLLLAAFAEWLTPSGREIDRAEVCFEAVRRARAQNRRLYPVIASLCDVGKLGRTVELASLHAAVIALISPPDAFPPSAP